MSKTDLGTSEVHKTEVPEPLGGSLILASENLMRGQSLQEDIASAYPPVGTVEDVAHVLSLPHTSVRQLCRAGQLEAFKVGKLWRITRSALVNFIENGGE